MTVYTIGHSTRSIDELTALLREAGVDHLVDVRTVPRSRTNPQFNRDILPEALKPAGIAYSHASALGGLRGRRRADAPSPNGAWRNDSFRNYADYAMTADFRDGLAELIGIARTSTPAVMCAEAVWWRCHRRLIADHLLARGLDVRHVMGPGKIEPARLTPGAEVAADLTVTYPDPGNRSAGPLFD